MRVLLVENDPPTAARISTSLQRENCRCRTVNLDDLELAIASLHDYDLILLDLMSPDIDGDEILRRLRIGRKNAVGQRLNGAALVAGKIVPRSDFSGRRRISGVRRPG